MADQQPDPAVDILQAWLDRAGDAPACTVPRADRERPLPASHAQQGMWLAQQVAGDDDRSLTAPHAYRLTGPLDVDALASALGAVLARHEVLRTGFAVRQGELFQVVADPTPFRLVPEDIAGPEELDAAVRDFTRLPFDLERDPLLRARLFRLDAQEHVLVAVFHHIANDGWSMDVFHRELAALYDAASDLPSVTDVKVLADVAELAEIPVQYPDFAVWQRSLADDEAAHEEALAHWREVLAGAPDLLALPTDRPRPAVRSSAGDRIGFAVPSDVSAAVADLATARGTTPFAVQFAAFQALLAAWSGQWDLITGITTANRALPETEELIGFFVNVLPIRGVLSPDESFADVLVRTGRSLIDAYKQDELPFELLLERLELPRAAGHNPLVQVTVASHQELTAPLALSGLTVEHLPPHGLDVQEDLTFYLTSGAQGVRGDFAFRTDLFDRSTMEELGGAYLRLLETAAGQPDLTLQQLTTEAAVPAGHTPSDETAQAPEPAGTAPQGVLEELVASVWSELLGRDSLTREANFFQVGGTSLAASRVANRLSEELGVRVPVRDVFRNSGLAALAAHLAGLIREAAGAQAAEMGSEGADRT
ncbi:condensation domain-containing protein [Streptomyces sp. NPDC096205]|uniref:condensation domain-containing protein n=1 Tax=Streptomyces sp. NPDC096205 TaxID=3366081 RepID=UPI0037FFB630